MQTAAKRCLRLAGGGGKRRRDGAVVTGRICLFLSGALIGSDRLQRSRISAGLTSKTLPDPNSWCLCWGEQDGSCSSEESHSASETLAVCFVLVMEFRARAEVYFWT